MWFSPLKVHCPVRASTVPHLEGRGPHRVLTRQCTFSGESGRLVGGRAETHVACFRDPIARGCDVNRGGLEVDSFAAPSPAPSTEPSADYHRRCTETSAAPGRQPRRLRGTTRGDRSRRTDPRCASYAEPVGSRSINRAESDARQFSDQALRIALEVLDRRRPVAHLAGMAEATVVAAVRTLVKGDFVPGRELGTAVLKRVDVAMIDDSAAELFAAYARGHRRFALAARIARTRADGWRITALRVR
ncbi:Rv3235 family protein [Nocardia sp. NPDC006044]|uniref:Rv3235 family protein n=1 Tax=Nocardia sp. NPDC006044 TaxID=3364306 RepID=UPI003690A096